MKSLRKSALAAAGGLLLLPVGQAIAQEAVQVPAPQPAKREAVPQPPAGQPAKTDTGPAEPSTPPAASAAGAASAADQIADIFSQVGDQIYEDCIFELSDGAGRSPVRPHDVLHAAGGHQHGRKAARRDTNSASQAVGKMRADPALAECRDLELGGHHARGRRSSRPSRPRPRRRPRSRCRRRSSLSRARRGWRSGTAREGVDFVTIKLNGYERKLTGGEICSPFQDVVREVPASAPSFRLGYTIKTGRLFVIADGSQANGQTIAWGLSGRDVCRNNPDPDCFAAKAIGPLPPGEYSFAAEPERRVSWGPRTKRHVVGIYLQEALEQRAVQPAAYRRHPGARQYRHPYALEGRDVGSLHRLGAQGLGLCRLADQRGARDRHQRLHRRAPSADRRGAACRRRLVVLAHLSVQVIRKGHGPAKALRYGPKRRFNVRDHHEITARGIGLDDGAVGCGARRPERARRRATGSFGAATECRPPPARPTFSAGLPAITDSEFRTRRSGGVRRQGRGSARPWAMTAVSQSPASLSSATSRPAAYSQGTVTVVPIAETNFLQPTS